MTKCTTVAKSPFTLPMIHQTTRFYLLQHKGPKRFGKSWSLNELQSASMGTKSKTETDTAAGNYSLRRQTDSRQPLPASEVLNRKMSTIWKADPLKNCTASLSTLTAHPQHSNIYHSFQWLLRARCAGLLRSIVVKVHGTWTQCNTNQSETWTPLSGLH